MYPRVIIIVLLAKFTSSNLVPKQPEKIQDMNMQPTQLLHCLDWQKALWAT